MLTNAFNSLYKETILYTSQVKTLLWKNMMAVSKIFLKKFIKKLIENNSKQKDFGMNTDWSMIWLLMWLKVMEDLFGLVKTMMEMSKVIHWLKDMEVLDYWLVYFLLQVMLLRLKQLMEQLQDIIENIKKERRQVQIVLHQFLLGQEVWHIELN